MHIERFGNAFVLWKNDKFIVTTPQNPHLSTNEGCHLIIRPIKPFEKAWDDVQFTGDTFKLASRIAKILIDEGLVDWANLQCNGNWGLLKGRTLSFHVHIYGRKKYGKTWGQPVELPRLPNTFSNEPISERDIQTLIVKFQNTL